MNERHQILKDEEFWTWLEFEGTRWLAASNDKILRRFWIDGLLPESITDTKFGVDVQGIAWIGDGPRIQHQYRFVASLPQKILHRRNKSVTLDQLTLDQPQELLYIRMK